VGNRRKRPRRSRRHRQPVRVVLGTANHYLLDVLAEILIWAVADASVRYLNH